MAEGIERNWLYRMDMDSWRIGMMELQSRQDRITNAN